MIGKPHWFTRRKYTGWGFSPACWQGWVYILVAILPIILLTSFPPVGNIRIVLVAIWSLILCFDFIDIIIHLPKDERDVLHEAIAERNALWMILLVLTIGVAFQASSTSITGIIHVDPIIIIALVAGLIVKIITNLYLDRKN